MSDQKTGENKDRAKRPSNRRPPRKNTRNPNAKKGPNKPNAKSAQGPKGKSSNNKRRKRRPSGPKLTGIDLIISKYNNLLEQYLSARKKYHDLFFRADPRQKAKLERIYEQQTKNLREFEDKLTPEDRDLFNKHFCKKKEEIAYTNINSLDANPCIETPNENGEYIDPHYLTTQIDADYSSDTEESSGSMEDYSSYKGL